MRDSFPLGRGRHHFFPNRSFSVALSSMASASSRFSRVFSSSNVFSAWQRFRRAVARLDLGQGSSLCLRRKRGEHNQAIGRSRGGRTTKIHALSDPLCRPVVLHLTPGQDADIAAAPDVLALAPPMRALIVRVSRDREHGFQRIVSNDFRGS
jgi:hypothetical protein